MKKLFVGILSAFVLFTLFPKPAEAQFNNSISGDLVSLAQGVLSVTYERRISATNSWELFGSFYESSYYSFSGYGIGGSYRWYLDVGNGQNALEGLALGPQARFISWSYGGDLADYAGGSMFLIGGNISYKWIVGGGFVIEPLLELNFVLNSLNHLTYSPVSIGVNLGYAWR